MLFSQNQLGCQPKAANKDSKKHRKIALFSLYTNTAITLTSGNFIE